MVTGFVFKAYSSDENGLEWVDSSRECTQNKEGSKVGVAETGNEANLKDFSEVKSNTRICGCG